MHIRLAIAVALIGLATPAQAQAPAGDTARPITLVVPIAAGGGMDSVMRIFDRTTGRNFGELRITTRVENAADVRVAANAWARALRRELDLAKGIKK